MKYRLRNLAKRLLHEVNCHIKVITSRGSPAIAFLPNTGPNSLRTYAVARELQRKGFRILVVPAELNFSQRQRVLVRFDPDIVLLHKARHPLNRREYLSEWPYVLDVDDADFHDPKLEGPMRDLAIGSVGVIAGSRYIAEWALQWQKNVEVVWTGTPAVVRSCDPPSLRKPVITWAQSDPLGYPKEREFVTDVILRVLREQEKVILRLYGWKDSSERSSLGLLNDPRIELELLPPMTYERFVESLCDVAVGLSPIVPESIFSRGKSFGKILAYLDARVPIVCSDEADHRVVFGAGGAIVSNDPEVWSDAICRLMEFPSERDRLADEASVILNQHLTIERSSERVAAFLARTASVRASIKQATG